MGDDICPPEKGPEDWALIMQEQKLNGWPYDDWTNEEMYRSVPASNLDILRALRKETKRPNLAPFAVIRRPSNQTYAEYFDCWWETANMSVSQIHSNKHHRHYEPEP